MQPGDDRSEKPPLKPRSNGGFAGLRFKARPGSPGLFYGHGSSCAMQVDLLRTALPMRRNPRRGRLHVKLRRSPQGDVGQKDGSKQTAQSDGLPQFQQEATSGGDWSPFGGGKNKRG